MVRGETGCSPRPASHRSYQHHQHQHKQERHFHGSVPVPSTVLLLTGRNFFVFTIWSVTTNLKLSFFFGRNFFAFDNTFPDQSVFLSFAHTKSAVHGRPSDLNSWQPQHSITFSNWEKRLHRLITNLDEHVRSGWNARAREKSPFQTKSCYHLLASSDIAANNKLSSPISCSPSSSSSSASFSVPNTQYTRDCALSLVN